MKPCRSQKAAHLNGRGWLISKINPYICGVPVGKRHFTKRNDGKYRDCRPKIPKHLTAAGFSLENFRKLTEDIVLLQSAISIQNRHNQRDFRGIHQKWN